MPHPCPVLRELYVRLWPNGAFSVHTEPTEGFVRYELKPTPAQTPAAPEILNDEGDPYDQWVNDYDG